MSQIEEERLAAPRLPLARYQITFRAQDEARMPPYGGSAWRGAFGRALKKSVCVTRQKTCNGCLLLHSCAYPYVFETPLPPGARKMRKYERVPHPFVIFPDDAVGSTVTAGTEYRLGLSLFGRADRFLPYVLHALQQAGLGGLTARRHCLVLERVEQEDQPGGGNWRQIYVPGEPCVALGLLEVALPPVPRSVGLVIHTPLRLQRNGRLVSPERFQFGDLFRNLLRRISMLMEFHGGTTLETDFAELVRLSDSVLFSERELHWKDWTRYSSRQDAEMQMGGIVGSATLGDQDLSPFWPYLWLGRFTHAGKGTSMGLGRYTLEIAASLPDTLPAAG